MKDDRVEWLVQEVSDLLDAGHVGLYEFIWLLRGVQPDASSEELRHTAAAALDRLRQRRQVKLVRSRWPSKHDESSLQDGVLAASDWTDPDKDGGYLSVVSTQ